MPYGRRPVADVEVDFDAIYADCLNPAAEAAGLVCWKSSQVSQDGLRVVPLLIHGVQPEQLAPPLDLLSRLILEAPATTAALPALASQLREVMAAIVRRPRQARDDGGRRRLASAAAATARAARQAADIKTCKTRVVSSPIQVHHFDDVPTIARDQQRYCVYGVSRRFRRLSASRSRSRPAIYRWLGERRAASSRCTDNGIATRYTYDALGNLTRVATPSAIIDYVIDGRGRRIGKKINDVFRRKWLYDGQLRIVAEQQLDSSGNVTFVNRFVYGSNAHTPKVMLRYTSPTGQPTVYRIFSDHLGSPRYIVNVANKNDVLLRAHYSAFGIATLDGGTSVPVGSLDAVPFGFAGGLYDPDTGLVHFGARDYDPVIGRWVSKDPILFRGGQVNLYSYVGNDPVNSLDPMGLRDYSATETQMIMDEAIANYNATGYPLVTLNALANNSFGTVGQYDFRELYDGDRFEVEGLGNLSADQFGNYFAGYVNQGAFGNVGYWVTRLGGNFFSLLDFRKHSLDDPEDVELIRRGAYDFKVRHKRWGGRPSQVRCGN